ncbi:Putative uncharacterized protein [Taphrina deformans PYCC 5710]|uniref:Meiotically up-regulated protein Msb1/Mug8 domain-containing protein n=1 Tax=Taphrina deformans (strain PYCC 5710 / ATCC 11124 / CBS 356.35 / IMI 108563 / JCM 9778 / NBRC 8474) TaxID=1097556 RepID=R4X841_TAPDE|nr:Putative uncharacterized protein [Taphrina deformans PYCC 5710]|eukprot:CCG81422.1 Putative uncharacterized protein [Taphrina deformans PYCC 5710]
MSPTPLSLLSRAISHAHRIDSQTLDMLSTSSKDFGIDAECFRTLKAIQAVNSQESERMPSDARDAEWLEFGNHGFQHKSANDLAKDSKTNSVYKRLTPNWSQFMLAGFENARSSCAPQFLPMHLHLPDACADPNKEERPIPSDPGVLSEVNTIRVEKTLWSAWVLSLANEMSDEVKGTFGRVVIVQPASCSDFIVVEEVMLPMEETSVVEHVEIKSTRPSIFRTFTRRIRKTKPPADVVATTTTFPEAQKCRIEERLCGVLRTTRLSDRKSNDRAASTPIKIAQNDADSNASDCTDFDRDEDFRTMIKWTKTYDEGQNKSLNRAVSNVEPLDLMHTETATRSLAGSSASDGLCRFVNGSGPKNEATSEQLQAAEDGAQLTTVVKDGQQDVSQRAVQLIIPTSEKYKARPRMLTRLLSLRTKSKDRPTMGWKPSTQAKSLAFLSPKVRSGSINELIQASQGQADTRFMHLKTKNSFVTIPVQRTTTVSSLASTNISTIFQPAQRRPPVPSLDPSSGRSASKGEIIVRCDVEVVEEFQRIEQKVMEMAK